LFGVLSSSSVAEKRVENVVSIKGLGRDYMGLLQDKRCSVWTSLSSNQYKFEVAVGVNGKVFLAAETAEDVILISRVIENASKLSPVQTEALVRTFKQQMFY
jgi:hypothetical protein